MLFLDTGREIRGLSNCRYSCFTEFVLNIWLLFFLIAPLERYLRISHVQQLFSLDNPSALYHIQTNVG